MKSNKIEISLAAPAKYVRRKRNEPLHRYRREFGRDRDRVLYSKAFRRLSGKTQIFLSLSHDHVRNRLTHTLEVAQIAKVAARNLSLDVDLTEAIALAHDLGHTPFGHVGERTLNLVMNNCDQLHPFLDGMRDDKKGFKHNLHGLRVTCHLEKTYRNHVGMNLTNFTLWGIKHHSKVSWVKRDPATGKELPCQYKNNGQCYFHLEPKECVNQNLSLGFYDQYDAYTKIKQGDSESWSFEAFLVAMADEIAQRHHDVEDAIFMNIVSTDELTQKVDALFKHYFDDEDKRNFSKLRREKNRGYFLPLISKFLVNMLNKALIINSIERIKGLLKNYDIGSDTDYENIYPEIKLEDAKACITFHPEFVVAHDDFQDFLKNRVLNSFEVQRMDGKGTYIIRKLFKAYLTNPKQLSDATLVYIDNIHKGRTTGRKTIVDLTPSEIGKLRNQVDALSKRSNPGFQINLLRGICDHIAGMTDNFAISEFKRLYGQE